MDDGIRARREPPADAKGPSGGRAPAGGGSGSGKVADPTPAKPEVPKPKAPLVWHKDAARPTFARVYVGDKNSLELVSIHVSVSVEGPRTRTLVDHIFRNPHDRQLEGTFEYPLPAGASPSYYAMFVAATRDAAPPRFSPPQGGKPPVVPELLSPAQLARQVDTVSWGKLQEAKVVSAERGAEVYEEVTRQRIDPALLEYASGNTFRGRVFPIPPKGYNRVLIAYEETLPVIDGKLVYRFALPGRKLHEMRFGITAHPKEVKAVTFAPKEARKDTSDDRVGFEHTWSDATPEGEVVFTATPADASVQAASGRHGDGGPVYVAARVRPELPPIAKAEPFAKHAVFLLDTSASEGAERFAVSMKLLQTILEKGDEIEGFNVLAFNAGAAWLDPKGWVPNTKEGRAKALKAIDGVLLEGATDLGAALDKLAAPPFPHPKSAPIAAFLLSDGHLTWGETDAAPLVARFTARAASPTRFFCYRTGLGQENGELFEALTRQGGGVFQCFGAAEIEAAAVAHKSHCLDVRHVFFDGASELLVAGRRAAVYPGGELLVVGQLAKPGKAKVVVEGTFAGKAFRQEFAFDAAGDGELAGRAWGEVAVASLLSLNDPWMDGLVTAYCQQFNIGSRAASFLVLESESDYKRFEIEKERRETLKGSDLGKYLRDTEAMLARETSLKLSLGRLLFGIDGKTKVLTGPGGESVRKMLELLGEKDCVLPEAVIEGKLLLAADAPAAYLAGVKADPREVNTYLDEANRRNNDGDTDGAVRALSTVIEQHPGRGDALRLVGYRLLDLRQPASAARLFTRVLRSRPFEPHSYRDLARALEDAGQAPLAALMNEAVLAGEWHGRFGDAIKIVTREDHARLLRAALKDGRGTKEQQAFFESRLKALGASATPADLRVSITWNTDNTDVDLHVHEPSGAHVMYSSPRGKNGELSADLTQGYGPERYQAASAGKGEYKVLVHYFRANPNLLGGETHVNVTITRFAGTDHEKVERRTVILRRSGEQVLVTKVKF